MSSNDFSSQNNSTHLDWSSLPRPQEDGAADHIAGQIMPAVELRASNSTKINLADDLGTIAVFAYPRTARPDQGMPADWDMIPGARGCTPQACSYRDLSVQMKLAGIDHIFGLSAQNSSYQQEAASRLHLPYLLLSDSELKLTHALKLPTMQVEGRVLLKRLTMILHAGKIIETFYPVFPPDENAAAVLTWSRENLPINQHP